MLKMFIAGLLLINIAVFAAEQTSDQDLGQPKTWLEWIGGFHLVINHFPIALLNMTALAELLYAWYRRPLFSDAARFMLVSGAILAVPTAILGVIYSYSGTYEGIFAALLRLHMWFGIATAILALVTAYLRESQGTTTLYYTALVFLFLIVNFTGMLGGNLVFGPYHMVPPA